MAAQQHKIMRQVLELRGCPPEAASHLQTMLRDGWYQRLLPLIEAACSELGSAGRVDRVDRLEIDLGRLPLAGLDAAMGEQLQKRLGPELAAALRAAPPGDAALELFSHFIATGCLPWWADRDDRSLLYRNLDDLLSRRPQALREALQALPAAPQVLRRLALRYPDRLLGRLAASLAPALSATGPAAWGGWLPLIQGLALARGQAASAARQAWWEEVLRAASSRSHAAKPAPALLRLILDRLAPRLGSDPPALLAALRQAVPVNPAVQGTALPALIDSLWRDAGGASLAAGSAARRTSLRDAPAAQHDEIDPAEISPAPGFGDADDLHLGNAGLVILWPFLATFFKRLGLTEDGHFVDAAAAQRGIGLLQFLASGDADPQEPPLPLNKLLCGLAPESVFDFGAPVTPAEAEACEDLLNVVIHQAPILQGLSLAGLRGSFLLRPGQLSARDGHWLLRVERLTHDIVLDRLPWGVAIVRLPWMQTLLQVEW